MFAEFENMIKGKINAIKETTAAVHTSLVRISHVSLRNIRSKEGPSNNSNCYQRVRLVLSGSQKI
jgi:hypothetical protein